MAFSSASPCGPFTLPRLSAIFSLLCVLYLVRDFWMPPSPPSVHDVYNARPGDVPSEMFMSNGSEKQASHQSDDCLTAPRADKVMVVLKTGATEIYEKLPTQMITLFRCTPHYLIFSDLAQNFSDHPIYDALGTVNPDFKNHHEDFELYRQLQQYHREGQNPTRLKGEQGWHLDKWKFMPMLHESYRMAPDEIDWFVYIEADTSLSWSNLLQYLGTMNPRNLIYTGAQNSLSGTYFAHGGSGFIISRAAAKKLQDKRRKEGADIYDKKWESLTSNSCCGDEIIARALLDAGVSLKPSWPRIQGETVDTLDWTQKHWCTPAVTWHHVSPVQVDAMWQYQKQWVDENGWSTPYLYKDVFDKFVARHISVNRTSWNNLSTDTKYIRPDLSEVNNAAITTAFQKLSDAERQSVESFDDCANICRSHEDCIQYMWMPGKCQLGKDIRLGDIDELEPSSSDRQSDQWSSGWLLDRIENMRENLEPCSTKWFD